MKIKWLGTGSAFCLNNYQTNALITWDNGERMLVDCGSDIRWALHDQGLSHLDVDSVFISHLHGDHIGGMEWLGFTTYFDPRYKNNNGYYREGRMQPKLYISDILVDGLWQALSPGMSSLQNKTNRLENYFNVNSIRKNTGASFGDGSADPMWRSREEKLIIVQTIHIMNQYALEPSFGLLLESGIKNMVSGSKKKIFLTCDTQYAPNQIMDFYKSADVIFQDCETTEYKSGVHANIDDLRKLPDDIKGKMYLVHYQEKMEALAQEYGFAGFVDKGQEFVF